MAYTTNKVEIIVLRTEYVDRINRLNLSKIDFAKYYLDDIDLMLIVDDIDDIPRYRIFLPTNDDYNKVIANIKNRTSPRRNRRTQNTDIIYEPKSANIDEKLSRNLKMKKELLVNKLNSYVISDEQLNNCFSRYDKKDNTCEKKCYSYFSNSVIIQPADIGNIRCAFDVVKLLHDIDYCGFLDSTSINQLRTSRDGKVLIIDFDTESG